MPRKQKSESSKYPFIIIPALLFVFLFILTLFDLFYKAQIEINKTITYPNKTTLSEYPIFSNTQTPLSSANGIVILNSEDKKIIYEKNSELRFSPASTTKIMTALTALSIYRLDSVMTVKGLRGVDSVLGLRDGDQLTFEDLLYAAMLPSDNLAAETIANNYSLGRDAFISLMNANAKSWNLNNTHFVDASGLTDEENYTTPYDLALLGSIAMQNQVLSTVASTKSHLIYVINPQRQIEATNLNKLLDYDGIVGLKTGHTEEAGDVLVTAKNEEGHLIIMVVMNSQDRFSDTKSLLDFIRGKINYLSIHP